MSQDGPVVDLARGDHIDQFRITSVLGHGREGVAAAVIDKVLELPRVLKAYRAEPQWVDRLRYVAKAFAALSEVGVSPRPISGGVALSSRGEPLAYLVVDHRVGRPLAEMIVARRWTVRRARRLVLDVAQAVTRIHDAGWSTGDFEAGGNIVMFEGKPLFIDIGMTDELDPGPFYQEDFECVASIALKLGEACGDELLIETSRSLIERSRRRVDRRSFGVWLRNSLLNSI